MLFIFYLYVFIIYIFEANYYLIINLFNQIFYNFIFFIIYFF